MRALDNIKTYFTQENVEYKIIIAEQNDNTLFNRGFLLNAAFIEAEKLQIKDVKYIHFNVDYEFNLERPFPDEIRKFKEGFLELHGYSSFTRALGGACIFDSESYIDCNGFPNDLYSWGSDDYAIWNRIIYNGISIIKPSNLYNSNFIIEHYDNFKKDISRNIENYKLACRHDICINGVSTCKYTVEGTGEFHDANIIYHLLITDDVVTRPQGP